MVEVSSQGVSNIKIKSGWLIFAAIAVPVFCLLFYFVENTGWNWPVIGVVAVIALIVEAVWFRAPLFTVLLMAATIIGAALIKTYLV